MKPFEVIRHGSQELLIQRVAFAILILLVGGKAINFSGQPYPIGVAKYVNLTFLFSPVIFWTLKITLFAVLILYASRKFMIFSIAYIFFYMVLLGTFENSQGGVTHVEHIIPLILLGQIVAHTGYQFLRFRKQDIGYTSEDLAVHFSKQAIVAIYVLSAIVKIDYSGICHKFFIPFPCWIKDSPLIALKVLRNHGRYYSDTLTNGAMDNGYLIANYMLDHPLITRLLLSGGLALELFAFLALINRTWSFIVGVLLITLHLSIYAIMKLNFTVNIAAIAIFLVSCPWMVSRLFAKLSLR